MAVVADRLEACTLTGAMKASQRLLWCVLMNRAPGGRGGRLGAARVGAVHRLCCNGPPWARV